VVPCASRASAAFAEAALIERLDPLLNGLGYGAKVPGRQRTGQRCSPFDALFPGRRWAPEPTALDRLQAQLRIVSYLTQLAPAGVRWDALTQQHDAAEPTVDSPPQLRPDRHDQPVRLQPSRTMSGRALAVVPALSSVATSDDVSQEARPSRRSGGSSRAARRPGLCRPDR
jgi:hypothetical protein